MFQPRFFLFLSSLLAALPGSLLGCGTDAAPPVAADAARDVPVDALADAIADVEAAPDIATTDVPAIDAPMDAGVAPTLLLATFSDAAEEFDVAKFGFNGDGGIRLEIYGGAADACPGMDSPTPERTLILPSIPNLVGEHGVGTASLLDFAGTLTEEPILRSTDGSVDIASASEGDSVLVFQTTLSFEGGTISGSGSAEHCTSLDE